MPIERTEFSSGLRVVTERMPGVRSVSIGFWVLAGSRDERPTISGHCHFLEHLLFKGTPSRSAQDIAQAFDAIGGDLNAFTAKEYTCYYARVLDRDLEMAIDHLSDMFANSLVRADDLRAEAQVILEEIHMHEDSPEDVVHDVFTETLWPGHPLGRPILGTEERIRAATPASVRSFYRRHYLPGNLVVAAAGNVKHEDLLRLLRARMETGRALGPKARSAWNLRTHGRAPAPSGATTVRRKKTEQAHVVLGTNGLPRNDPDRFAFWVVNSALGGGMSSRLFQEIREKRGLAYTAYSYHGQYTEAGLFSAYAGTTPARAKEVVGLMRREIEAVRDGELTAEEFTRAKGHVAGATVLSLEDPGGRMARLGKATIAQGEILTLDETLRRIRAVTLADAQRVAHRVLSQPMTLTVLGPFGATAFRGALASIRVGVVGATGKMGRAACAAILADDGLDLAAAISRSAAGSRVADVLGGGDTDLVYTEALQDALDAGIEVLVDFTSASFAPEHVAWGIEHGVHVVEGTTGFEVDDAWRDAPVGIVIAPNFAIGAVLMMRFAEQAAKFFDAAEVLELHHDQKKDAPGGTAIATARAIAAARAGTWSPPAGDDRHPGARGADVDGVRVHAVRLPGLLAHQEVILGGPGQTLTIRHDSTDRASFMPGVLLAIRWATEHPGLTIGLDPILG